MTKLIATMAPALSGIQAKLEFPGFPKEFRWGLVDAVLSSISMDEAPHKVRVPYLDAPTFEIQSERSYAEVAGFFRNPPPMEMLPGLKIDITFAGDVFRVEVDFPFDAEGFIQHISNKTMLPA